MDAGAGAGDEKADDPRVEEQEAHREKVGRWRQQVAQCVREFLWWGVLKVWFSVER
jgi:hypothetical protein